MERETGVEPATLSLGRVSAAIAGGHNASQAVGTTQSGHDAAFQPSPSEARVSKDFASPLLPDFEASVTVKGAAARLRVCIATVYRLCARGELRHFRVSAAIRIREKDLAAYQAR